MNHVYSNQTLPLMYTIRGLLLGYHPGYFCCLWSLSGSPFLLSPWQSIYHEMLTPLLPIWDRYSGQWVEERSFMPSPMFPDSVGIESMYSIYNLLNLIAQWQKQKFLRFCCQWYLKLLALHNFFNQVLKCLDIVYSSVTQLYGYNSRTGQLNLRLNLLRNRWSIGKLLRRKTMLIINLMST